MTPVAICIPTYNQSPFLERAIQSALAQTHPCDIWVSDDASTDDTPDVMARILARHPQITYVRHRNNLGIPGNPHWVLQQPTTDYVVRLDSDDELCPNYVQKLLPLFQAHPLAGYAHAAVKEIDEKGNSQRMRLLVRNTGFQSGDASLRASVAGYRVAANICMFRQAALLQVNYYRSGLSFCEDWDLAVCLADAGWGNIYQSDVLAKYRVWDTPDKARARRKLAELEGCRRVIEDRLIPAFRRRNWSLGSIERSRRRLALGYAECLRSGRLPENDLSNLRQALCALGDSAALRWKFQWIRTPLAPLFQVPATIGQYGKNLCKAALFRAH